MIITTLPNEVMLSGAAMPLNVSELKYKTGSFGFGSASFQLSQSMTDGDIITFKTSDNDLVFTCKNTPVTDYEIPPYTFGNQAQFVAMVDKIINNYLIRRYYDSFVFPLALNNELILAGYATNENPDWWITDVEIIGPTHTKAAQVPDLATYNERHLFLADIIVYENYRFFFKDLPTTLDTLTAAANDDNTAGINLESTMDDVAGMSGHPMVYGSAEKIAICANSVLPYSFLAYEEFGNPLLQTIPIESPVGADQFYYVVKSGMRNMKVTQAEFKQFYVDAAEVRFLTQLPNATMRVTKDMPNRLYFYNKTAGTNYQIKGNILLDDGTTVPYTHAVANTGYLTHAIYKVLAGYDELELELSIPVGRHALRYSVYVYDGTNNVAKTEEFWFKLETRYSDESNFFYFHNAFGGYDGVWMSGELILGLDHESFKFKGGDNVIRNKQRSTINTHSIMTGVKYKEEIMALGELLNSDDVYWISKGRVAPDRLVQVSFENKDKNNLVSSLDYTKELQLEFTDGVVR